ncbi:MAG: hypothetical protein ACTSVA_08220 [Candidatus Njordarchaeales archaeon]
MSAEGLKLRLRKGDMELEVSISSDFNEKQLKLLQRFLSSLLSSANEGIKENVVQREREGTRSSTSIYERLRIAISSVFRYGQWFNSLEAKEAYEEMFGEEIRLSTCSTYLRRLEENGFLISRKQGRIVEYSLREPLEVKQIARSEYMNE